MQDDRKMPSVGRQVLYGGLLALFCFGMAALFAHILIPEENRDPRLGIPLLLMMMGAHAIGRVQVLACRRRDQSKPEAEEGQTSGKNKGRLSAMDGGG